MHGVAVLDPDQIFGQHQHCHTHQRHRNTQLLLIDRTKPLGDVLMLGPTETHGEIQQRQARLMGTNSFPDQSPAEPRFSQPEILTGTRLGSHGYALELKAGYLHLSFRR